MEKEYVPILCMDFDGVIHSYTSPWKSARIIPDPPVSGAFAFLLNVRKHFDINIYSSRSAQFGGIEAMKGWFVKHGWPTKKSKQLAPEILYLSFPLYKPAAFLTIDDRVVCFTGTFPTVKSLLAFKPWNKK